MRRYLLFSGLAVACTEAPSPHMPVSTTQSSLTCNDNPCPMDATCADLDIGYYCTCPIGLEYDGFDCVDIDECANETFSCSYELPFCENTENDYQCYSTTILSLGSVASPDISNLIDIDIGEMHTIALDQNGTVYTWGYNFRGQLDIPVDLHKTVAIAAGYNHSLALAETANVYAWGDNWYGQLNIPEGTENIIAVDAGIYHSIALKFDGTVVAWGDNWFGQSIVPTDLHNVIAIAAGNNHNLALISDGTVIAWGNNAEGQTTIPEGLSNVIAIAAGDAHSLALKADGTVIAWGYNGQGQIWVPIELTNVVSISAGSFQNIALRDDGTIMTWGTEYTPSLIVSPIGLSDIQSVIATTDQTFVIKRNIVRML